MLAVSIRLLLVAFSDLQEKKTALKTAGRCTSYPIVLLDTKGGKILYFHRSSESTVNVAKEKATRLLLNSCHPHTHQCTALHTCCKCYNEHADHNNDEHVSVNINFTTGLDVRTVPMTG